MNKNRIAGAGRQVTGSAKEAAGKLFGDKKLVVEGKIEVAAGKVQSAVGEATDTVKKAVKP
jgi:uncharacterized protein YjbJ (UPF0337 family)